MSKKKGPFSKAWKEVKKVKRETFRIIDQGLDLGDKGIKILGVDKILGGGGSIGISTSSGRGGGHNVHFTPSNRSVSVGIGISNNGTPSLFVDNQAALPLTAPPPKFLDHEPTKSTPSMHSVEDRIAERDQLLREVNGPGYIPESSLATMGLVAIGQATAFAIDDTVANANIFADVHSDTWATIYGVNDIQKSEPLNRNIERGVNITQAISTLVSNPSTLPTYYEQRTKDAADAFSLNYQFGDLIGAGAAAGQTLYDVSTIAALTTAATKFTSNTVENLVNNANKFAIENTFRSPISFQFDNARLNSGIPFDSIKLQNPVVSKTATTLETKKLINASETLAWIKPSENTLQNIFEYSGSGPVPGVISINPNSKSFKALDNYNPKKSIEFVYDPERKIFSVGKVKNAYDLDLSSLSFHQRLAKSVGANENTVLGGTFSRTEDGAIRLTEHSGHYGTRWKGNDITRQDMLELLSRNLNSEIYYDFWEADLNKGPRYGK